MMSETPLPMKNLRAPPVIWVSSADEGLRERITALLDGLRCEPIHICSPTVPTDGPYETLRRAPTPAVVVLDADPNLEWVALVIDYLRRERGKVPTVVLTEKYTKIFIEKVITRGPTCTFPRDFPENLVLEAIRHFLEQNGTGPL